MKRFLSGKQWLWTSFILGILAAALFRPAILPIDVWAAQPKTAAWQSEWDRILPAARKEGQVNVYMRTGFDNVLEVFKKDYSQIKVLAVTGSANQVHQRVRSERRAGVYIPDVIVIGVTHNRDLHKVGALDPMPEALLLPEVVDQSRWYEGRHVYVDSERRYAFAFLAHASVSGRASYNVNMVNPDELRSIWDLVNPKWKGKIVSLDPLSNSMGNAVNALYANPEIGPNFLRKFYSQEHQVTLSRDRRQMMDWLGSGRFSICIACRGVRRAKKQGLPVDDFHERGWKERGHIGTNPGTLALMNRGPHPHAARVFINWFLSRTGQLAVQRLVEPSDPKNSARIDIPKDGVRLARIPVKGVKYVDTRDPFFGDRTAVIKLLREILSKRR